MYVRERVRERITRLPANLYTAYVSSWNGERWYVSKYDIPDRRVITEYKYIGDDWNRSADRSATRNVRAVTRTIEAKEPLAYFDGSTVRGYSQCSLGSSYFAADDLRTADYTASVPRGTFDGLQYDALESVANGSPQREAIEGIPFLGELRETVQMVRNPVSFLKGIQPALNRLLARKGRKGRRRRRNQGELTLGEALRLLGLGPTSNGWLQYSYGWKPLMNDLAAFSRLANSFSNSYSAYVQNQDDKGLIRKKTTWRSAHAAAQPNPNWTGVAFNGGTEHIARCLLWYRYKPSGQTMGKARFLANKLGLVPEAILPAAWELTRLSFVVDWFIPVGDTLRKLTSTPVNFDVVKQQYDYTTETSGDLVSRFPTKPYAATNVPQWKTSAPVAGYTQRTYERHAYPFVGVGDPSNSWFTTNRAVSALALIAQALLLPIPNRGKT